MIVSLEQGSTTKGTAARLDSACRSRAQRHLEQGSTGMVGAVLYDRLDGARFDNQAHWNSARQCLPEKNTTAPGAMLDRDGQSGVR